MKFTQPNETSGCLLWFQIYPSTLMILGKETKLSTFLFSRTAFFLNFLRYSYINPKIPHKELKQQLLLTLLAILFFFPVSSLCVLFLQTDVPWSLKNKRLSPLPHTYWVVYTHCRFFTIDWVLHTFFKIIFHFNAF